MLNFDPDYHFLFPEVALQPLKVEASRFMDADVFSRAKNERLSIPVLGVNEDVIGYIVSPDYSSDIVDFVDINFRELSLGCVNEILETPQKFPSIIFYFNDNEKKYAGLFVPKDLFDAVNDYSPQANRDTTPPLPETTFETDTKPFEEFEDDEAECKPNEGAESSLPPSSEEPKQLHSPIDSNEIAEVSIMPQIPHHPLMDVRSIVQAIQDLDIAEAPFIYGDFFYQEKRDSLEAGNVAFKHINSSRGKTNKREEEYCYLVPGHIFDGVEDFSRLDITFRDFVSGNIFRKSIGCVEGLYANQRNLNLYAFALNRSLFESIRQMPLPESDMGLQHRLRQWPEIIQRIKSLRLYDCFISSTEVLQTKSDDYADLVPDGAVRLVTSWKKPVYYITSTDIFDGVSSVDLVSAGVHALSSVGQFASRLSSYGLDGTAMVLFKKEDDNFLERRMIAIPPILFDRVNPNPPEVNRWGNKGVETQKLEDLDPDQKEIAMMLYNAFTKAQTNGATNALKIGSERVTIKRSSGLDRNFKC